MGLGFALGAWTADKESFYYEKWTPLACSFGIALLLILRKLNSREIFIFIFAFFHAFAAVSIDRGHLSHVAWRSPKKIIILLGEVASLPEKFGAQWKWQFKTRQFRMEEGPWKTTLGQIEVSVPANEIPPLIGDRLILKGQVRYPEEGSPGAVWSRRRYFLKNIQAEIRVKKFGDMVFTGWNKWLLPLRSLQLIRELGMNRIEKIYPQEQSAVLGPLLLGLRMQDQKLRGAFSRTGTSHLLSVSGFHAAVIAGIIFAALVLLRFSPNRAVLGASFVTLAYMALTGWGVAVQRAGMMAILVWIAWALGRPQPLLYWLNTAFAAILWTDPKKIWDISFQLSFLSMYGILLLAPRLKPWLKLPGLDISCAAFLATYPVVLFHFQSFSWIGIFANLVAVPAFALILPLGFFSLIPGIGFPAAVCAKTLLGSILWILQLIADQPWSSLVFQQPNPQLLAAYYLLGGLILWLGPRLNGSRLLSAS